MQTLLLDLDLNPEMNQWQCCIFEDCVLNGEETGLSCFYHLLASKMFFFNQILTLASHLVWVRIAGQVIYPGQLGKLNLSPVSWDLVKREED